MASDAKLFAQRLVRYRRDLPNLGTMMAIDPSKSASEATKQDAIAGLLVALTSLPHAVNTLGMRAEGSTTSADYAGTVIDRLDEPPGTRSAPPTGLILDGMLREAAFAIATDSAGSPAVDSIDERHFHWSSGGIP